MPATRIFSGRNRPYKLDAAYEREWVAKYDAALDLLASQSRALEEAQRERDLAIAHDRQPYPTAWAYEQVCKARDKHQARAEQAEAARERLLEAISVFQRDRGRHGGSHDTAGIHCRQCWEAYVRAESQFDAALATPVRPTEGQ